VIEEGQCNLSEESSLPAELIRKQLSRQKVDQIMFPTGVCRRAAPRAPLFMATLSALKETTRKTATQKLIRKCRIRPW